jgi:glycine/D-amino acid oxidase-like deaminating enzyme
MTSDATSNPYWWDAAPPVARPPEAIPRKADVVIVGGGYTGLRAALTLSRAGRQVVVLEREDLGSGASRRNAGFLGRVLKKKFTSLIAKRGIEHAIHVYRELDAAYQTTMDFIAHESISCYAARPGRFIGATSAAHYDDLAVEMEQMKQHLGLPYYMVSRADQRKELATDVYFGGAVIPDLGCVHPGLYHRGLQERALDAGTQIRARTHVVAIKRSRGPTRFTVKTDAGDIDAKDVLVATNGYTTQNLSWFARRVIPFKGYMAATEELPPELLKKMIPNGRVVIDTNTDIDFFRIAPDSRRMILGGATASGMEQTDEIAERLHTIMSHVLPDLTGKRFTHIWSGYCAGTFDMMPHVGGNDGLWYAMGYNFAGVTMGTYMGNKVAMQMLGDLDSESIFARAPFPTVPLYTGNPWFMPLAMRYFHWSDARIAARR